VEEAKVTKVVKARELWNQVIDAAWTSAEPGLLFWDTVKRMTPTEAYASKGYANVSTNPCAELILSPYDSCRLLLVDLTKFVKDAYLPTASFDFEKFKNVSAKAQKLMDDLVDLEIEAVDAILKKIDADPESSEVKQSEVNLWKKIRKAASGARRTGLGITGLGDALACIGVTYGSEQSVEKTEEIYKTLALSAYRSTVAMAKDRGPFPVYDWQLENESSFLKRIMEADKSLFVDWVKYGRRNIALTTTAPAGSVSCLTQTTSGIEPACRSTRRQVAGVQGLPPRLQEVDGRHRQD
jgi:ribonucleoside-diphosphate reductase alpha chain